MSATIEIDYFNTYILKKVVNSSRYAIWPNITPAKNAAGTPNIAFPGNAVTSGTNQQLNWYVEEARIRGGYNNTSTDFGVKAYLTEDNDRQERRKASLIYSGVYNSRTGINDTNQFPTGAAITKSLNPVNGSIQKLYAENTNLDVLQENKSGYLLIDKDTIYTTESGTQTQAAKTVLGQLVPYSGEYGISKDPRSFAIHGTRKYYTDRDRNTVCRLSRDGITEINRYGMFDYFRDELSKLNEATNRFTIQATSIASGPATTFVITNNQDCIEIGMSIESGFANPIPLDAIVNSITYNTPIAGQATITASKAITVTTNVSFVKYVKDRIIGGWDIHNNNYVISIQHESPDAGEVVTCGEELTYSTVAFDEEVKGWTSFYNYRPNALGSLKDTYYSFKNSAIWEHYDEMSNNSRGKFYDVEYLSSITFLFNDNPSLSKNFNTISYEGSAGWRAASIKSDFEGMDYRFFNVPPGGFIQKQDTTNSVLSYLEGRYETSTPANSGLNAQTPPFSYAGFARKENRYVANIINNSVVRPGEVIFGNSVSGLKGFFVEVKFETDKITQKGGMKELFSVSSNWVPSAT
jgi:hypothetical protein